jgi:hypothetical protein
MPVPKSKKHPSASDGGAHMSKQNFQMQMMQGLLGALFQSVLAAPAHDPYQEGLKKQQALLAQQKQEQQKQEALQKWKKLQAEETARVSQQEAQRKKQGEDLLAKMGSLSDPGLKPGATESGRLQPYTWESTRAEFIPLGAGRFDTSSLSSWQRLLCASHFSNTALTQINSGNPEGAEFMNRQADSVTAGGIIEVECAFPALPQVPEPQESAVQMQAMTNILEAFQMKLKDLQNIEIKLADAKKQKLDAEIKLKAAETKITKIKSRPEDVSKLENEMQEDDLLLQQALAELNAAKEQLADAEHVEQKCEEMKNKGLDEIKNMEQQAMKDEVYK